jgi:hypothetical protein
MQYDVFIGTRVCEHISLYCFSRKNKVVTLTHGDKLSKSLENGNYVGVAFI